MSDKKLLSLLFLFVFVTGISLSQPVKDHGNLSVKETQLIDQHGETIMLQGVSFGWHNWWPRFYNQQAVKWLRDDWSCDVVRAAMGIEPEKGYLESPDWSKDLMEEVIEGAIENDIYVIIDWHSHGIQLEAARAFFIEMAEKYGEYPHIIYEIFNEPVKDSWDEIKSYSVELIETIREIDPDNIILVGSPHWDQDIHIVADDPITGHQNIMYTLHFYAATHHQFLRDRGNYALEKGVPLFVSESAGMEASGDGPIDYEEWHAWIDWMRENKISWVSWSITDKDETCSMLNTSASSDGNWKEGDLKESGIKTRELLRDFAGKE
ncbi:MAG: glycoside hydrolase family 5 protein [Bacteroidales bacterium]|nr:glycoside hydrolase family 5 protein [Bacteroidales bacterium]